MGKHRLEDTFKDKLYNLNTPVDTSEIWAGIQNQNRTADLSQVKQTSSNKWKWSALMLLCLLLGATLIFNGELFTGENAKAKQFFSKNNQQFPVATEVFVTPEVFDNNATIDAQDVSGSISSNSGISANTEANNKNEIQVDKSNAKINKAENKKASASKTTTTKNSSINSGFDSKDQIIKYSNSNTSSKLNQFTKAKENSSSIELNKNLTEVESKNSLKGNASPSKNNGTSLSDDVNKEIKTSQSTGQNLNENKVLQLPSSLLPNLAMLDKPIQEDFLFQKDKTLCYDDWNNKRKKFAIIPYAGIDLVTNKTEASETFVSYLEQRRSTMKFLEVLKGGLLFKFNVSPNFYFKVGGAYDQIRERFEHVSIEPMELILPDQVIAIRVTMEGDTIPITGDGAVTIVNTTTWVKHNEYHSFNIPAIIGYESFLGGNFSWYAEVGIFYNLLFQYQGTLLDANNKVVNGENFFLNQTGTSIYGALGLNYMLSDNLSATFNASYRQITKSINNADLNPIDQNLGLVGLALGLEYRF